MELGSHPRSEPAIRCLVPWETWQKRPFAVCTGNHSLTGNFWPGACFFLVKYLLPVFIYYLRGAGETQSDWGLVGGMGYTGFYFQSGRLAPCPTTSDLGLGPWTVARLPLFPATPLSLLSAVAATFKEVKKLALPLCDATRCSKRPHRDPSDPHLSSQARTGN